MMAGALAGAPMCTTFSPRVPTRISSSAALSISVKRQCFQSLPPRDWRKDRSGYIMADATVSLSATSDCEVVSRREVVSLLGSGFGAVLLVPRFKRADGINAAAAVDLRDGGVPNRHEGDIAVVISSWQNWVKTWLV